jgi:hypothetical protein
MDKTDNKPASYELFTQGIGGMFLTAEFGNEKRALPLLAIQAMTFTPETEAERIVLEFTHENLEITGQGLGELFDHLTLSRVKTVRVGSAANVCIQKLILLNG